MDLAENILLIDSHFDMLKLWTDSPMPLHAKAASTTVPFLMQLSMRVLSVSFLNSYERL